MIFLLQSIFVPLYVTTIVASLGLYKTNWFIFSSFFVPLFNTSKHNSYNITYAHTFYLFGTSYRRQLLTWKTKTKNYPLWRSIDSVCHHLSKIIKQRITQILYRTGHSLQF